MRIFSKRDKSAAKLRPFGFRHIRVQSGITLLECLIFVAVLSIIMTLAVEGYFRLEVHSRNLRQSVEDITRVMHAGERWREDIRSATGPVSLSSDETSTTLRIPKETGDVAYIFKNGSVTRNGSGLAGMRILDHLIISEMKEERGKYVISWHWELELKTREKQPKVRPLFSFQAVVPPLKNEN